MNGQPLGMHHVSSISGDIARNHDFYTDVLGLRLVKKSVNQDSPSMYHLFYADAIGSPGSDTTFFDYPGALPGTRGNNSIARLSFRVAGEAAFRYWLDRFEAHATKAGELTRIDGVLTLDFEDTDGTPLRLVDDDGFGDAHPWEFSPVDMAYQLRGLGYPTLVVPTLEPTDRFLTEGLRLEREQGYMAPDFAVLGVHAGDIQASDVPERTVHVYSMSGGGPHAEVHVVEADDLPPARGGAGSVHHIALRVPDHDVLKVWKAHLDALGYHNSGLVDRYWFESVYVREPNGILFELATDGPGFAIDEDEETLGESLSLPPFMEPRRAEIEAGLRPLE